MTDVFDRLRAQEERNYLGLQRVLGDGFQLMLDLLEMYDEFAKLTITVAGTLADVNQPAALMHLGRWLKHEAIGGAMMLMRGHIADSSNFSRRSVEICAFMLHIYNDPAAAKRWMEAGTSNRARSRYVSEFQAWKLVKDLLPVDLVNMYEEDCLDVHPSFFGVTKRVSFEADRTHRFKYFDLDESDGYQTFFVMNFFNLCVCHGKIMEFLVGTYHGSGSVSADEWFGMYRKFIDEFDRLRDTWTPRIEAYFREREQSTDASL